MDQERKGTQTYTQRLIANWEVGKLTFIEMETEGQAHSTCLDPEPSPEII